MKNVSDVYPLTPMQQLMLIHARSNPGADTLFSQFQYTIKGPLDHEVFRATWEYVVSRHPALKTIFLWKDLNQPLQVVKKETKLPWVFQDWRGLSEEEQQVRLAAFLEEDSATGFELDRTAPIRFGLFRMEEGNYHLVWSSHHLILDRWCLSILAEEVPSVYQFLLDEKTPGLPPAKPFKGYISWLQKQDEAEAKAFWQSELKGYGHALPLNALRSIAPTKENSEFADERSSFPPELAQKIAGFARKEQLTIGTVLQGAWCLLMTQYNNANDAVIGVTVSGRPADLRGVEHIVGTFINNLPVRVSLEPSEQIAPWLKDFHRKMSEMQKYDYVSQDKIQQWCDLPFDQPPFDTLFVYQQAASPVLPLNKDVRMIGIPEPAKSNFPITLTVEGSDEKIEVWITSNSTDISQKAVSQLNSQFQRVANWIVDNPDSRLQDLSIFTEDERRSLVENRKIQESLPVEKAVSVSDTTLEPPRNSLEALIAGKLAKLLHVNVVGVNQSFMELGGSSLQAVQLLATIEEETGIHFPISVLFESPTVRRLAEVVEKGEWQPKWETMVAVNKVDEEGKKPLFIVPPAATSALHFTELARHLENDYSVFSFTPIGLDNDREPQNRVEEIAELYLRELRDVQGNGPYQIAGSCFGNLVAYEMARQLESQGESTTLITIDPFFLTQWMPKKRNAMYYLGRIWHFLTSGVLFSEFVYRTWGIFKRKKLKEQDRTKNLLLSHDIARRAYVVEPFNGNKFYIQSEENHRLGYHQKWNELSGERYKSYIVNGTNHGNLLSSKNLDRVAETIVKILDQQNEKK